MYTAALVDPKVSASLISPREAVSPGLLAALAPNAHNALRTRPPDFAPSSETPDVAPSFKLRKAMSGKPGGYVAGCCRIRSRGVILAK